MVTYGRNNNAIYMALKSNIYDRKWDHWKKCVDIVVQ